MQASGISRRGTSGAEAIRIRVPATTSNLGPAFDAVGLALQLYLRVEIRRTGAGPSSLEFAGEDQHLVPRDETNLIWRTMAELAREHGHQLPSFAMKVENEVPITKGLGSSASACLAAAAAADFLCGLGLPREEWLSFASRLEGHPDNAAPALHGGLVASISGEKTICSRSAFPPDWTVVAVTPDFELETKKARAALPIDVVHQDAVFNVQRTAFLMSQVIQGRREGVMEAMKDKLHQPYRCALMPGLKEVLEIEEMDGLIGIALSGAGSSVIAFSDFNESAIAGRIVSIFGKHGLRAKERLLKADNKGMTLEVLS